MLSKQHPNLLIIMSDEHAPMYSGPYRHPLVQTPNMDRLAEDGVTFANAYCNSPLCMPSRMSFMTGQYIHKIGAWDNAGTTASRCCHMDTQSAGSRLRWLCFQENSTSGDGSAPRVPYATRPRSARRTTTRTYGLG